MTEQPKTEALARLEDGIEQNRREAGEVMRAIVAGDPEAGDRLAMLNLTFVELENARRALT